jgi:hypothetical protein
MTVSLSSVPQKPHTLGKTYAHRTSNHRRLTAPKADAGTHVLHSFVLQLPIPRLLSKQQMEVTSTEGALPKADEGYLSRDCVT